ncbi:non-ribosomal peptide synthetase [Cystobacter fuscus]|uniref:non-ribosomal peptide synthetase n=1 Tax=Cystobacter fuscus TaxID=43 RepID=UPI0012FE475B|nr:non-ribosomal peptide synthetase [Cystobacter fuscus]
MHAPSNSSGFPLSPNQRRLWWLRREGAIYNAVVVLRVSGPLDPSRLDTALREVWARHDALSARFLQRSDLRFPLQSRALEQAPTVEVLPDSPGSLEDLVEQLARRGLEHSFDLVAGPLLYAARMSPSTTEHLVLLARPSLSGDAQAQCRLAEELLAAYAGRALEEEPGLEHAQYAEWQNQLLAEPEPAAAEYWARATERVKPLTLPFERLRREGPFLPASVEVRFAGERVLPGSLLALARAWRVSPSTLLAAAWSAVAARWLEAPELVLGYVEPARAYEELRRVQGLVAKTLPLSVPLEAEQSLAHAARALEESLTQARDWVEHFAWDAREETARAALPVAFEFQEARLGTGAGGPDCRVERLLGASDGFVLKLSCVEDARGITCEVVHDARAVDEATARLVARMVGDFLASVARAPESPLRAHGLLEPSALQPLAGPPGTPGRLPTVVERFNQCVRDTPRALALVQGARRWTYAQVGERTHRLARFLRAQGVGAETVVAVAADRSMETVVAMLAILEAGGAFLPVDPAYPPERIDYMLRDADVRLAVGAGARRATFGQAPRFVALDETPQPWADESPEPLTGDAEQSSRLAYVLYTSGSTGQPKGCQLEVHNLSHYIHWANTYYFQDGLAQGHFGLYTSLSFDLTLTSVFCALTRGRTLHVFDEGQETLEVLRAMFTPGSGIDVVKMTPSHISLVDTLGLPGTGVRKVIAGGEALTREHLLVLRRLAPDLQLYNEYGPTETTVGCVVKEVQLEDDRVLIGTPIDRTQVAIVDEAGQLVPPLVAGELWIAGEGVGRGYLHAPERSAEKFRGLPQLAAHAYRTGDKVRQLAHGELDYLGRIDDQVKVRGYRIEPGEIEQGLLRHPAVKQALVMARPVRGPELELVAYVVSTEEVPAPALRELLRRTLPEHMVPGWFVRMERMPLTRNGKVDRALLPAPSEQGPASGRVAPRTPLEERIAAIWRSVLVQEDIGVNDVFAERGGHSLKAMLVVGRVAQELGLSLTLRELFEAPTIAGMAALLERRGTGAPAAIPPTPAAEDYALSDAQRRLWALDRMDGPGEAYLIRAAFVVEGALDVGALERALTALLERHEPLRTSFHDVAGEPRQRIHPRVKLPLEVMDLPGAHVEDAAVRSLVEDVTARPFDLTHAPLMRVRLLRLSPTRALLVFAMHHIIGDGWSVAVLAREWTHLYDRALSGAASELPALRVHYKDYQLWRLARLEGPEGEADRRYWHERLGQPPAALELPVEFPRPSVRTYRGGSVSLRLPEDLTRALTTLARERDATLFMALVASVKALLYRYTGQEDLVVGTAIAGRGHPEVEHHIGVYINLLVLRDTVRGAEDFPTLLGSVRQTAREAYEHAEYPFDRLVRELDVVHDASRSPLFDVLVVLQNNELPVLAMRGATLSAHPLPVRTSTYDLSFEFAEDAGGLVCELHYNADLFGERRARQLAEHWRALVSGVVAEPSVALDRLRLLSAEERQRFGGGLERVEVPGPRTLTDAVRERFAREPDALAVVCGERQLSLRELMLGAQRIARHLVEERALRGGEVVAVVGARTERIPMALVGVLEAGGVYLPIDAQYPLERVRFMLEDSQARVVLADAHWARLLAGGATPVVELDAWVTHGEARSPGVLARPEDVAALIYTSGSTGRPKGVRMEHRGILNTAREFNRLCEVTPEGRVLQFASLAFDAALLEMSMSLVGGAPLVVAGREVIEDTAAFTAYLEQHQVSFAILPPVYLNTLERHELPSVKTLVTAGEAPNEQDARHYAARKRYVNAYGPAECSVCVTMHEVKEGEKGPIAVGRPLRNVGVVVVDGALNALPAGVVGEVCVSGVGVARGYVGREELTGERFVEHAEYGRVYRTGDKGRWREDGTLEYVGRGDEQVKVRGQRVELEEVRRKLLEHAGVEEAVVVARAGGRGVELEGFVVGAGVKAEEVRGWLGQALPAAMVPARLRVVEQLPLTSNGKVDKKALLELGEQEEEREEEERGEQRGPATKQEEVLARVWREVLGRQQVGWSESYFELGGDSIKAIRMAARLRQEGWRLEVRQVFMHPRLEEMARQLKQEGGGEQRQEARGEVELTGVQRWWAGKVKGEERNHFNNAVMMKVEGRVEEEALRKALEKVGEEHEALRLRWKQEGGELKQEYAGREEARQLGEGMVKGEVKGEEWREELEEEAERLQRSLDLEKGPVARLGLYGTPEGQRVVWVVHHVAVDAVSWGVLVEDLASAYREYLKGQEPVLPARTASFQSWSLALRRYAERISPAERSYWDEVDRALVSIPAPGEKTAAPTRNRDSSNVALLLPAARTKQLLGEAHRAYNTQAGELVLVALARALRSWLGSPRIALAMEGHGRVPELMNELDVSRTVGWFTCLYPLVLELAPRDDVGHHIKQVKESLRSVPSQGVGYGLLRHAPGASPVVEPSISFNYLGQSSEAGAWPAPFGPAPEPVGTLQHPESPRLFALDVLASVEEGSLRVDLSFDVHAFRPERIRPLMDSLRQELELVAAHCMAQKASELTPSDIDYAGMSISELDAVMNAITDS